MTPSASHHACTYFDRGYLAHGVALWQSLRHHDPLARLVVLALDDDTVTALRGLDDERLDVWPLEQLLAADSQLAAVRATRSRTEFVFTLTPCLVGALFAARPNVDAWIYLDADLFFFAEPGPIWNALREASVLVVPHRYPPWHDDSARYGRFNVGVVGFRRDANAQACIAWWRQQCLASTSLQIDDAHYGDQKYLDAWPERFGGVVESRHPGVNVAPWNWPRHHFELTDQGMRVDGEPLVVFHFAQFRRVNERWFDSGQLEYGVMPRRLRSRIYGEYWSALEQAETAIRRALPAFRIPQRGWFDALGPWHLALLRLFWGQFWRRSGSEWIAVQSGLRRWGGRFMGRYRRRQRGGR